MHVHPEMPVLSPHPISSVQITPFLQDCPQALFLLESSLIPQAKRASFFSWLFHHSLSLQHILMLSYFQLYFFEPEAMYPSSLPPPTPTPTSGFGVRKTWSWISVLGLDGYELLDESCTSLSFTFICKIGTILSFMSTQEIYYENEHEVMDIKSILAEVGSQ